MTPTATDVPAIFAGGRTDEILRRLDLVVSRRLDGLLQGDYRGLVPGHGSDPGEARAYQPGDDVRRLDWNVTARMREPHIRETIADRELETWALIDLSPSLSFGTADCEKRDLAIASLAAIGFLTAKTGNRFGAVLVGSGPPTTLPARSGRKWLQALLRTVLEHRDDRPSGRVTELGAAIDRLNAPNHRRGLAVVISDFLAGDDWQGHLELLGARHDVLAVEVIDPRELELPNVGVLAVVDPETGRRTEIQTASSKLRDRYREAAAAQREANAEAIRSAGADHLVLRTDRDWLGDIVRFVALRRERIGRLARAAR